MRGFNTRCGKSALPMKLVLAVVTAVWLVGSHVYGQVLYGSLVGNVVDQNKATVPGATVTITNKATGQIRETVTNNEGEYSITNILSGTYDIKVTKQGFTSFTQTALTITANNITRTDVEMKIGNVSDVVSVTAAATVLQTESATVKSEISSKEINALPLANYRNYQSLINLVPGTTPGRFQNAQTDTPEMSLTTSVNGTSRNNNNTRLDGATSVNIWLPHHTAYVPSSESIQEVNVSTNNFDAEQGLAGGAAIQVITKSGGNQFHGSGFIYHDNHLFRAKNFFQPTSVRVGTADVPTPNKPKSLRTINGATLGGPIKKDKLFFFGSWESQDERMIADGRFTVPTLDQRAGNFSAYGTTIYDPRTGNIDGSGRTPFANATIPDEDISPISKKLLALIPLPNLPGTTSNFYNSAPFTSDRNNFDVKMNWNRNTNHQVWWKFSHMRADVTAEFALGAAGGPGLCIGTCGSGTGDTKSYVGSAGHTWTLGSGFLIDGNFSITQRNQQVLGPDYGTNFGLEVLGIPGTNGTDIRQSGFPQFNFATNTYTGLGNQNNWSPTFRDERSYTFTQNATKIRGSHDVRFGMDLVRHELNHWQPEIGVGPRGAFTFNGSETVLRGGAGPNQFNSFAAFLLGVTNNVQKSLQFELMTTREWQMGFFFRDRWQVSRNLTLTLGLRYERYPMMHRADRGIELLDLNSPVQLTNGIPNGNMNVLLGDRGSNESSLGVTTSNKLFAPRIGFAYRIGDDMVIRSGYGITYDPMPFGRPLRGFYPLTIAQTFVATAPGSNRTFTPYGNIKDGIPPFTGPDLTTGVVDLPGTVTMRTPYLGRFNRGYIQSWNLFIERKLINDIKVEVGYAGTQSSHQLAALQVNTAEPGGQQPLNVKYGRTADTLLFDGFLSANYHALQVAINRRYSNGLFIKGAYTWSKAINMTDDTGTATLDYNSPSAISRNRALSGYDIPHNLQLGASYELPFGKGKKLASNGLAATLFGGWQLSPLFRAVKGRPFSVTASNTSLQAPGSNTQNPDQVGEVRKLGGVGPGQPFYDPSAFQLVTGTPRFGTVGRNTLRGPGEVNLDLSILRTFRIKERSTLDFRVDAFNFTNTPHFMNPASNISGGNFLIITQAWPDQRQFRFGLRFGF
jgi:Carboxypeptidase regulatory-like domain/TonB dependent receptor